MLIKFVTKSVSILFIRNRINFFLLYWSGARKCNLATPRKRNSPHDRQVSLRPILIMFNKKNRAKSSETQIALGQVRLWDSISGADEIADEAGSWPANVPFVKFPGDSGNRAQLGWTRRTLNNGHAFRVPKVRATQGASSLTLVFRISFCRYAFRCVRISIFESRIVNWRIWSIHSKSRRR